MSVVNYRGQCRNPKESTSCASCIARSNYSQICWQKSKWISLTKQWVVLVQSLFGASNTSVWGIRVGISIQHCAAPCGHTNPTQSYLKASLVHSVPDHTQVWYVMANVIEINCGCGWHLLHPEDYAFVDCVLYSLPRHLNSGTDSIVDLYLHTSLLTSSCYSDICCFSF